MRRKNVMAKQKTLTIPACLLIMVLSAGREDGLSLPSLHPPVVVIQVSDHTADDRQRAARRRPTAMKRQKMKGNRPKTEGRQKTRKRRPGKLPGSLPFRHLLFELYLWRGL